jgi:uncharacterized protein YdeI (YjbR/CyaY-like superfamily)
MTAFGVPVPDGEKEPGENVRYRHVVPDRGSTHARYTTAKDYSVIHFVPEEPIGGRQLAAIAQADGRWDAAYDSVQAARVPPDLASRLDEFPKAKQFFESLNSKNRYAILFRIQTAKKPETRAKRIDQFVDMLMRGEKIYP